MNKHIYDKNWKIKLAKLSEQKNNILYEISTRLDKMTKMELQEEDISEELKSYQIIKKIFEKLEAQELDILFSSFETIDDLINFVVDKTNENLAKNGLNQKSDQLLKINKDMTPEQIWEHFVNLNVTLEEKVLNNFLKK